MRRDEGAILLIVLILMVALGGLCAAMATMSVTDSRDVRHKVPKAQCFYAAESGIAMARYDLANGGDGNVSPFIFGSAGDVTLSVDCQIVSSGAMRVVSTSTSTREEVESIIEVHMVEKPATIPRVSAIYISSGAVLDLSGDAFRIAGNSTSGTHFGISTGGSPADLVAQMSSLVYDQVVGEGSNPSIGEMAGVDPIALWSSFATLCEIDPTDLGTEANPVFARIQSGSYNGNGTGYGVLLVEGTLTITGSFDYEGLVIVKGDLVITGTASITGSVFVTDTLSISGTADIEFNGNVLDDVEQTVGWPYELVSWKN